MGGIQKKAKRQKAVRAIVIISPILLILMVGVGVLLSPWIRGTPKSLLGHKPQREIVYPVLYSDKHITENAIVSDYRFKDTVTLARPGLLANVVSILWEKNSPLLPPPDLPDDNVSEKGSWLWTPTLQITPRYRDSIIAGAKQNGVRNIYLSLDSYLDIYTLPDGPTKDEKKKQFNAVVADFVTHAHKNGITVDAEGGWRNWAERGHEYKAFALLEYAINYNKTHEEKLRGFQFDIEPYLLEEYKLNKKSVLRRFVALIDETVTWLSGSDLAFSVTIPEFYDGINGETPKYFYEFRYGSTIDHLLRVLEKRPGSKIIVMAYRNFAEGENGAIDVVENEMRAAISYQTKIVVAQETGDFPPPYITFHSTSRARYERELEKIEKTFSAAQSYGGISVHYLNALMSLR